MRRRKNMPNSSDIFVIAHRGSSGVTPENTMIAFKRSIEEGSNAIELDIHLSKDNEIIVCHDATVNRTTNGTGYIREMDLSELKQLDAGSWFAGQFAGETLPLLKEVFECVPNYTLINIEIKNAYEGHLLRPLLDLIMKYDRTDSVVISSFDHKFLKLLKLQEPKIKIGVLISCNMVNVLKYIDSMEVEVYSIHPDYKLVDKEDIQEAVKRGIQVFPYTIDSIKTLHAAIDSGVTGIMTNYPSRLKNIINLRRNRST
jgi:glycerophosphoryl diester phosphodiesterase